MRTAVFVAPFFMDTTMRFVREAAGLSGVRLALLSQDPIEKLDPRIRSRLVAHRRLANALDPQQIADGVRAVARETGPVDRVFGALEQLQVPLAEVREGLAIEGLGVRAARNFRDKSEMKNVLHAAGVPCARHRLIGSAEEARAFVAEVGYPVVAKPPDGAGGRNTYRIDDAGQLDQALTAAPPDAASATLLEEFVVGEEHSFDCVSIRGVPVWHSLSHYVPGPLEVLENPWIQWCVMIPREVDHPRYDDIRKAATRGLAALGMHTGLSHMEWFRRGDGTVAISEVGARPPGAQFTTLISYAHDLDMYRAWARLMIFDAFDPPKRAYAAGAVYLRGQGRGRVQRILGLDRAQRELGRLVVEVKLPRFGQSPASGYEGEGYVIVRHPETAVVRDALHRLVRMIRVELG